MQVQTFMILLSVFQIKKTFNNGYEIIILYYYNVLLMLRKLSCSFLHSLKR